MDLTEVNQALKKLKLSQTGAYYYRLAIFVQKTNNCEAFVQLILIFRHAF